MEAPEDEASATGHWECRHHTCAGVAQIKSTNWLETDLSAVKAALAVRLSRAFVDYNFTQTPNSHSFVFPTCLEYS
jgi:hypothetical protein